MLIGIVVVVVVVVAVIIIVLISFSPPNARYLPHSLEKKTFLFFLSKLHE
jgi:hypothetical protein